MRNCRNRYGGGFGHGKGGGNAGENKPEIVIPGGPFWKTNEIFELDVHPVYRYQTIRCPTGDPGVHQAIRVPGTRSVLPDLSRVVHEDSENQFRSGR